MTKEEKINTLKAMIQECEEYEWWREETLFEIIKDLEQKPCEDAISRQAVLDKIRAEIENCYPKNYAGKPKYLTYFSLDQVLQIIDKYKNHVLQIIDKYKLEGET